MRHEARQVPSWLIFDVRQNMKHAIEILKTARLRATKGPRTLKEKEELTRAITLLKAVGDASLPQSLHAVVLDSVDFGPFAEYRLLWDGESEQRNTWREIPLRLSPGDVVLMSREQFSECEARRSKGNRSKRVQPNKAPEPTPGAVTPRAT